MTAPTFALVPDFEPDADEHRRKLARAINSLRGGKMNVTLDVTLTANAAATTITDSRIGYYSQLTFMPMTANADVDCRVGPLYVAQSTLKKGSAVVTHANNANVDRTHRVVILG